MFEPGPALDPGPLGLDEHDSVMVLGLGAGKPTGPSCMLPGVFGVFGPPPKNFEEITHK